MMVRKTLASRQPDIVAKQQLIRSVEMMEFAQAHSPYYRKLYPNPPLAEDVRLIANWLAIEETENTPGLIFGTSSDRIGTPSGQAFYGTFSKDLEAWTGLPIAPYVGASFGTFDEELVAIGGLRIAWTDQLSTTNLWDGHNLHHTINYGLGGGHLFGLVITNLDENYDVGLSYSIRF